MILIKTKNKKPAKSMREPEIKKIPMFVVNGITALAALIMNRASVSILDDYSLDGVMLGGFVKILVIYVIPVIILLAGLAAAELLPNRHKWVIAGSIAAAVIYIAAFLFAANAAIDGFKKFDRELWNKYPALRFHMADNLVNYHRFENILAEDLFDLLGPPESQTPDVLTYDIGSDKSKVYVYIKDGICLGAEVKVK